MEPWRASEGVKAVSLSSPQSQSFRHALGQYSISAECFRHFGQHCGAVHWVRPRLCVGLAHGVALQFVAFRRFRLWALFVHDPVEHSRTTAKGLSGLFAFPFVFERRERELRQPRNDVIV
jgi:hypothetical protein